MAVSSVRWLPLVLMALASCGAPEQLVFSAPSTIASPTTNTIAEREPNPEASNNEWCDGLREFDDDPTGDAAKRLHENPPPMLVDDLETMAPLFDALKSFDEDDPEEETALAALRQDPAISAATRRVTDYVDANC